MGITNLKVGLSRKFAAWTGERVQLEKQIAAIEAEYATVELKRARIQRLVTLTTASIEILSELDPNWQPASVKPVMPRVQQLPFEHGAATRVGFDIMRELGRPTNPRELAPLIVARLGFDPSDDDLVIRTKVAIDAALRKQKDENVRMISERPTRWEIISD